MELEERRQIFVEMTEAGLVGREMARRLGVSHATIKYWMKKFDLKSPGRAHGRPKKAKNCRVCGKVGFLHRCQSCHTRVRRLRTKLRAIQLLGGKCNRCGYNGHPAAFEFHHREGHEKAFTIGMVANKSWDVVVKELEKCELLCSNCHRAEHSSQMDEALLEELRYLDQRAVTHR